MLFRSWNFGPYAESIANVWDVATKVVVNYYQKPEVNSQESGVENYEKGLSTNYQLPTSSYLIDLSNLNDLHEAKLLMLDISKAKFRLGWEPRLNLDQTVELSVDWYKRYKCEDGYSVCLSQIDKFITR